MTGLSIPFLLPRGAFIHFYYVWGVLAPGAILLGVMVTELAESLSAWTPTTERNERVYLEAIGGVVIISLIVISAAPFGAAGLVPAADERAVQITKGENVRDAMAAADASSSDVVIVTDLPVHATEIRSTEFLHAYLTYGGLAFGGPNSPKKAATIQEAKQKGARVIVTTNESFVETHERGELPEILLCDNDGCTHFQQ